MSKTILLPRPYLQEIWLKRDEVPDFSRFPFSIPAVKNLERLRFHPDVTFLIGENGTGKSTLLEAIADIWGFNTEGGNRNIQFADARQGSRTEFFFRVGAIDEQAVGWLLSTRRKLFQRRNRDR